MSKSKSKSKNKNKNKNNTNKTKKRTQKTVTNKGGGAFKKILEDWENMYENIFTLGYGQQFVDEVIVVEHLETKNTEFINLPFNERGTLLHSLILHFVDNEDINYLNYVNPDFDEDTGRLPDYDYSYEQTYHYGTVRTYNLILYLLNREDIDVNASPSVLHNELPINHLVDYLSNTPTAIDENVIEVNYRQIKEELLPLFFIKGASIHSLSKKQVMFTLNTLAEMAEENVENAKEATKEILRQKDGTTPLLDIYKEIESEKMELREIVETNRIPREINSKINSYLIQKN